MEKNWCVNLKSANILQKFYTGEKKNLHNFYTFCTFFCKYFCKYFCKNFCTNFYTIFTQNLHNFYTLSLSSRGLKLLCKFEKCKIFTQGKIFFTQFLHILHIFCKKICKNFCTYFYTPLCTNFAPFLQMHILQIFLHLRPREESVRLFIPGRTGARRAREVKGFWYLM